MKHDKIVPMQDKILVKRADAPTMSKGGIIIPEIAQEELHYGTVVAAGPGKVQANGRRAEMSVEPGDKIYFTKNAVIDVMHDGAEHLMMKEDRVLLIEGKKSKLKVIN